MIVKHFWYNFYMPERIHHSYPELDQAVTITLYTKSPEKWLLIDRETGQTYLGSESGAWDRLEPVVKPNTRSE